MFIRVKYLIENRDGYYYTHNSICAGFCTTKESHAIYFNNRKSAKKFIKDHKHIESFRKVRIRKIYKNSNLKMKIKYSEIEVNKECNVCPRCGETKSFYFDKDDNVKGE